MQTVINRTLKATLLSIVILCQPSAHAAFSLNKTRVIVGAGSSSSVEITNHSPLKFGMQSWVEEVDSPASELAVTPRLLTIEGESDATLRLLSFNKTLSEEQLFYLNVQEIPPENSDSETSTLSLAVRTRIKLLVRPENLFENRPDAEKQILVSRTSDGLLFRNPTPYYFAVAKVTDNKTSITSPNLGTFSPNSEVRIKSATSASEVTLYAIDDYGATNPYILTVKE
ncbi:fimbria/pilus periplasmic chaperone [Vibrio owensii]|uniref:fimbria/pilus periplasmic chaperone n=1 Tax=Vibrio owensii TaxID=696485 RepID=UPI003AAD9A83